MAESRDAALRARLDQVEAEARAVLAAGPRRYTEPVLELAGERLALVAATREVLDRHGPWFGRRDHCHTCCDDFCEEPCRPCPEVLTWARAWQVPTSS